ncbi:flocculation protein FLO11-like isoform X2 [Gouania willdenowi]|uniref:Flocculation protein FLO11-like n=1 Tax=Gouania willdenowi TaxID=441366 RepID=A0A8C5I6P4_GOUWI|nr:flocculation protein FLO11-like isoform X2 [Gouania willdenowi]
MELPLGGPALRHYTQSRPRPHRQKLNYRPSRPQETIIESENEVLELIGRVDEGVEEFFTKKVLPVETLKEQDEEIKESITVHEVAPASSAPCPPPTKTLRRKLGDFFTLKKKRGLKSETSHEGRPKKASIADFIRPLREVARSEKDKDKDRVKENDKENEKANAKEHPSVVHGESAVKEAPGAPPMRSDAAPPRRALREGKSQSLILLSGSAAAGSTNARNTSKKQLEGQHSFEQKLHLMLQRIGVSKPHPGETQNQEGEMKKAESEGTIIDSKPEPPSAFSKPRTMSASSDTRHQIRASVSAHEGAGKPALPPKPVIKPGPPPTTSGHSTPENELTQIEETESNTSTELSPAAAVESPAIPAATTQTLQTISSSVCDSNQVSLSSTVAPSETETCTDYVSPIAHDTTPANSSVTDSKTSVPESCVSSTDLITTDELTTSNTTATVSVTSTSILVSVTPGLSITSTPPTTSRPSISATAAVTAPINESSDSTVSTIFPLKPEAAPSVGAPPSADADDSSPAAASDDAVIPVTTAASSSSTSTSDTPSGLSVIVDLATEMKTESTSASLVTETSPPLHSSCDIITAEDSHDTIITISTTTSSDVLSPTLIPACVSVTTTSSDWNNSEPTSTVIPPEAPLSCCAAVSCPSTSTSETSPTDTSSTTPNHADTTSTTSSITATTVSSALTWSVDQPPSENVSTGLISPIPKPVTPENSSATSPHPTAPTPSNDSLSQEKERFPHERLGVEPPEEGTDAECEIVQKGEVTEKDEETKDVEKKVASADDKPAPITIEATFEEEQIESMNVKDQAAVEPTSEKDDVQRKDEREAESEKQDEAKSVSGE